MKKRFKTHEFLQKKRLAMHLVAKIDVENYSKDNIVFDYKNFYSTNNNNNNRNNNISNISVDNTSIKNDSVHNQKIMSLKFTNPNNICNIIKEEKPNEKNNKLLLFQDEAETGRLVPNFSRLNVENENKSILEKKFKMIDNNFFKLTDSMINNANKNESMNIENENKPSDLEESNLISQFRARLEARKKSCRTRHLSRVNNNEVNPVPSSINSNNRAISFNNFKDKQTNEQQESQTNHNDANVIETVVQPRKFIRKPIFRTQPSNLFRRTINLNLPRSSNQGLDMDTINRFPIIKYKKPKVEANAKIDENHQLNRIISFENTDCEELETGENCQPNLLENSNLSASSSENLNLNRCSICLEDLEEGENVRLLFCFHQFHINCIDTWLSQV